MGSAHVFDLRDCEHGSAASIQAGHAVSRQACGNFSYRQVHKMQIVFVLRPVCLFLWLFLTLKCFEIGGLLGRGTLGDHGDVIGGISGRRTNEVILLQMSTPD